MPAMHGCCAPCRRQSGSSHAWLSLWSILQAVALHGLKDLEDAYAIYSKGINECAGVAKPAE